MTSVHGGGLYHDVVIHRLGSGGEKATGIYGPISRLYVPDEGEPQ